MRTYLLETYSSSTLFVDPEPGPLLVLKEGQPPTECLTLPSTADELMTWTAAREAIYEELFEALQKTTQLSKPARAAAEKLIESLIS